MNEFIVNIWIDVGLSIIFTFTILLVLFLIGITSDKIKRILKGKSRSERASALAEKQAQEARKKFGKGK